MRKNNRSSTNPQALLLNASIIDKNETFIITNNNEYKSSQIFNKLKRDIKESYFNYNTMILIVFNLNIAQFCLPYMARTNGIFIVLITLIILMPISYRIQKDMLITLLENRNSENCNFCKLVEEYINPLCASGIEILYIIWFCMLTLLNLKTFAQIFVYFFDLNYSNEIVVILLSALVITSILLNSKKNNLFSKLIPYTILGVQIITLIVSKLLEINIFNLIIQAYVIETIYRLIAFDIEDNDEIVTMKFDSNLWDIISIVSACSNTIMIIFRIANNLEESLVVKSNKLLKTSNIFVFSYYLILLVSIFFSNCKGKIYPRFYIYLEKVTMSELMTDSFIIYLNLVWIILNVVGQLLILDTYFRVIRENILRPKTKEVFFSSTRFYISTIGLVFIISIFAIFWCILNFDAYIMVSSITGMLGVLVDYFFPVILYVKFLKKNILSFHVISRLITIYILCVICFGSFFDNILW